MNMSQNNPIAASTAPPPNPPIHFVQFPDDIINIIASNLDPNDFGSFRQVCRKTRHAQHSGFPEIPSVNIDRNLEQLNYIAENDFKLMRLVFGTKLTQFHEYRLMILNEDEETNPERQLLEEDDGAISRALSRYTNQILNARFLTFQNCLLTDLPPNNASSISLLNTDTENIDNIQGVKFVNIQHCKVRNFQALSDCLYFDSKKAGIQDISYMTNARFMCLVEEPLKHVANLQNLSRLFLTDCKELISLSDLPSLVTLSIKGCTNVSSISNMKRLMNMIVERSNVSSFSNCNQGMEIHIMNCDFHSLPDCNFAASVSVKNCGQLTDIFGLRTIENIKFDSCNLREINLMPISNAKKLHFENMKLNFRNDNVLFNADSIVINSCMIGQVFMKKAVGVKSLLLDQCWIPKFDIDMKTDMIWISNSSFVEYPLVFPQNLTCLTMKNVGYADEDVYDPEVPCTISNLKKLSELKITNCDLFVKSLINLTALEKFIFMKSSTYQDNEPERINTNPSILIVMPEFP
jgi:hypothetical protein